MLLTYACRFSNHPYWQKVAKSPHKKICDLHIPDSNNYDWKHFKFQKLPKQYYNSRKSKHNHTSAAYYNEAQVLTKLIICACVL